MPPEVTSLFRKCSRCGGTMELKRPVWIATSADDEPPTELKDWEYLRDNPHLASVKHPDGECPDQIEARAAEAAGQHDYLVRIVVERDGETVIEFPSDVMRAGTWDEVKGPLSEQLGERWQRAANLGSMIDVPVVVPVIVVEDPDEVIPEKTWDQLAAERFAEAVDRERFDPDEEVDDDGGGPDA